MLVIKACKRHFVSSWNSVLTKKKKKNQLIFKQIPKLAKDIDSSFLVCTWIPFLDHFLDLILTEVGSIEKKNILTKLKIVSVILNTENSKSN